MMNKRIEMNEEMMMEVNGGLIVVDHNDPYLPKNTVPVVIEPNIDPVTKYLIDNATDPKQYVRIITEIFG